MTRSSAGVGSKRRRHSMITGKTRIIAHLGYPTESFKAPMIYNPYFEKHGIDAVVVPMGCKVDCYCDFFRLLFKLSNIHGALITMPHKVSTVGLLDDVSTTVKVAGSCNAVILHADGRRVGDMFPRRPKKRPTIERRARHGGRLRRGRVCDCRFSGQGGCCRHGALRFPRSGDGRTH